MINLIKKTNLNLSILETDFDVFSDIANTFSSEVLKKDCLIDLDDFIIPEYFRNKITIALQTNKMLIGYITFEFKNSNNITTANINKLYVLDNFKNKNMENLLIEGVCFVANEVGSRTVQTTVDEHDKFYLDLYRNLGFYELGMNEDGNILSTNVSTFVNNRKLNDLFRDIEQDSIDYKNLKLDKKITKGRSSNIYLTKDNQILKMFTSNSFTFIKDREETLKVIKNSDIDEIVKPKNLVYYDGVFIGYIMDYIPDGESVSNLSKTLSFEEKIKTIKTIEDVMKKLHQKNIYVNDLNPDNIFITKDGKVKLIDCDSFIVKEQVISGDIDEKFKDPYNKIVSKNTDIYAFAITCLEILTDVKIKNDATFQEVEKIYIKNKNKLPVSFKNYFSYIFNGKERAYLSDSYQNYMDKMYNEESIESIVGEASGKVSAIVLSFLAIIIAVIGLIIFKYGR